MPTSCAPWPGNSQAWPRVGLSGREMLDLFATEARARDHYGLSTLVVATDGAGVVRPAHGAALWAARQTLDLKGQVTAPLALACFGITFLWQWRHCSIPSLRRRCAG